MKCIIAKFSFALSLILFFSGFLLLCYCPGWYAMAAGFAAVAAILGTTRLRAYSLVCFLASCVFTDAHYHLKVAEQERFREIQRRLQEQESVHK